MKITELKSAAEGIEQLSWLADLHVKIATNGAEMDLGAGDEIPDHLWEAAAKAVDKLLLNGIERMFDQQSAALTRAGIEDVPTLAELKSR